jgi:tRNA nucleotidyltransferase (CCA-adding enzyme)
MSEGAQGSLDRLHPPGPVIAIAKRLEDAGFETWCVGGAVRDALLGEPNLDWDLATAARPPEVRRLFRRTVPVGVEHGTLGVLDDAGMMHEVTTFRRDVRTDGRHAEVEFGATLEEDLARRDFTINAIAYSPTRREVRDPFGGQRDLERRLLRAVGDPATRMREDRLRALRAIRFASRYRLTIAPDTWRAVRDSAPHLGRLSPERVQQELVKTMEQVDRAGESLVLWRDADALRTLIPALAEVPVLELAVLDHLPRARRGTPRAEARTLDRLTALFASVEDGQLVRTLDALRFSRRQVSWIVEMVSRWRELGPEIERAAGQADRPSDGDVRRWVARAGRVRVAAVMRLIVAKSAARRAADQPAPPAMALASLHRRLLRAAFRDPVELSDLAVDGDDILTAGVSAGPHVGRILRALLDDVLEDPSRNTRDWLLTRSRLLHSASEER